ncbi:MAG: hypothetical protein MCM46_14805 [Candidatus Manganitrophus sp. SB1]|nr:hypothetical protein [Candidatus Manganitrophus morganii]
MKRSTFVVGSVVVWLILSCLTAFSATDLSDSASNLAENVISKLVAGDFQEAVAQIHEPATYDGQRAAEDRRSLTNDLDLLFKEFGNPSSPKLAQSIVALHGIEIAGGDVPYWKSLPNRGVASAATYLVNFSKVGPGVIVITLTRVSGMWELRSIALGIEQNRPNSRKNMLHIGRSFFLQQDPSMHNDEIDRVLNAMFGS